MSSRAYKIDVDLNKISSQEPSFNYTHSDLEQLLEYIGVEMPVDNGGMGVPLVLYRHQIDLLESLVGDFPAILQWHTTRSVLEKIRSELGNRDYVIYYLA